jgi:hypothetical protein
MSNPPGYNAGMKDALWLLEWGPSGRGNFDRIVFAHGHWINRMGPVMKKDKAKNFCHRWGQDKHGWDGELLQESDRENGGGPREFFITDGLAYCHGRTRMDTDEGERRVPAVAGSYGERFAEGDGMSAKRSLCWEIVVGIFFGGGRGYVAAPGDGRRPLQGEN